MITEFIDGLQQFHFLQNALITAIAIGIVAGAVGCFIILEACLSWEPLSHTQFFLVWLSPLSWASISLLALLSLASWRPSLSPISRATPSSKSDTAIGITFSSFLALGVIPDWSR